MRALEKALEDYVRVFDDVDRLDSLLDLPEDILCIRPDFLGACDAINVSILFLSNHVHPLVYSLC